MLMLWHEVFLYIMPIKQRERERERNVRDREDEKIDGGKERDEGTCV